MENRVKKYMNTQIVISVLYFILGIALMIIPDNSINTIGNIMAVSYIIFGIYLLILDYEGGFLLIIDLLPAGILSLVLGVLILLNQGILLSLLSIIAGIWIILASSLNLKLSLYMKEVEGKSWMATIIITLISIISGIILLINPKLGIEALTPYIGLFIIVYAISNTIVMVLFKKYMKRIAGYMKKRLRRVD